MDMFILLTVLQILSLNEAYNFTCPSQAHWNFRAKSTCKPQRNYTCLFDVTLRVNVYRERCSRPRILAPGYKYVFQPNLNRATCSVTRYQPFIFDTIGNSDCIFQKSLCNSLGQETYQNGNTTVDRKCICNADKGYAFVRNSQNQRYCNPSTDDCSCHLGISQHNKTIGLNDMKCYDDTKRTGSRYLGDRFNISRKIKIIEFDNYNYNLNYYKYQIEAFQWVLTLSLASCVVCIILLINRLRLRRYTQMHISLAAGTNHLLEEDKIRFNKLLQTEKTENKYFIRIMIVGKESTGKTCLLRRLLKKSISGVTSTDGVDIVVRRCKINIKDGTWIIGKDINNGKVGRIKRALSPNAEDRDTQKMQVDEAKNLNMSQRDEMPTNEEDIATDGKVSQDKSKDINESLSSLVTPENLTTDTKAILHKTEDTYDSSSLVMHDDSKTLTKVNLYKNKDKKKPLVMPEDLMSNVFSKSTVNTPSILYALCELWDFAGQKEFYATHQAFLTSSAVYLLVADMKDDIRKQELSQCFADFQNVGEYVEFWFDSIHCHRKGDERATNGYFHPPILLVFTGKDKYDKTDFENRQKELTYQIDEAFGLKSKYYHLHKKFYLSNLKDTDEEFEKLRYEIYKTAKNMDNWGNPFPLKWVLLEHLIEINKNDGKHFINFTEMSKLAKHSDINIINEDDLLLFLRFQHNVGNIIFFESIPDLIILNPQWLADAFRCLVSDRIDNSSLHHREDWSLFIRQGKISESLITELFKAKDESQFSGQKDNLHEVMEKLDILVKIENSNYIMPSMMPSANFKDVCEQFGILTEKCKRSSWLCFKFEFLPPSFFNHLSAWFIRKYGPIKLDSSIVLYRGICMFDIHGSGWKKVLVTMSTDTIALQVVSFSEQHEGFGNTCSDIYSEVKQLIEDIKDRYTVKISFKLHFKCSDGYYYKDTFEYKQLTHDKEFFCIQHKEVHQSEQLYSPWMKKGGKGIPDRAKINTTQDDQNPKIEPNNEEFAQDQTPVKTNLPVSVTLRQQFNIKKSENENPIILNCIKIDKTLVFTDIKNNRLIICNSDGTDIHHIPLSYTPNYMTVININTVAVSCFYDRTILIINISTRSVTSTINTSDYCYGMSYNDNNRLIICNSDGTDIHPIPLSYEPYHMTVVNSKTVAVSCTGRTIPIINISTGSVTSTINTSGICWGISYNDNNLYVVINYSIIHVMDLTGKVIRTIPLPSDLILDITVDRDRLVCIDYTSSIYCCSLDGKLIWKFKQDKFQDLRRVTTDNEGNVYATSYYTNTVVVISDDGQHRRELLTKSDGLNVPWGIYFDKKENILLVCNYRDGKAFLFDVKRKST